MEEEFSLPVTEEFDLGANQPLDEWLGGGLEGMDDLSDDEMLI